MGKEKKSPEKFTISFNPLNPKHQKVMDILNRAGRSKAYIIAEAVDMYMKICKQQIQSGNVVSFPTDTDNLKQKINHVEEEMETALYEEVPEEVTLSVAIGKEESEIGDLARKESSDNTQVIMERIEAMDELNDSDIDTIMANMNFLGGLADDEDD